MKLTPRQSEVLETITALMAEHGRSPTIRELMDAIDVSSPNGVECHLKALEAKGAIVRVSNTARSIQVVGVCPCCGRRM